MKDDTVSQSPSHGSEHETARISIELTPGQLGKVIRDAAGAGNISVLLSGLEDIQEMLSREPTLLDGQRTSRSLLIGLLMIASFPSDGTYTSVASLAQSLNMSQSTTHRYLTTLVLVGLAEQDPKTRLYRLAR